MAEAKRTIDLVFNGVDKTGAAVQSAIGNTSKFSSSVQGATQPFADASAAALKYEAALLATGAAITAFSIKAAGDFDSGFREIASLIDEPISALGEFRQAILDYGSSSSSSLEQVNSAVYSAISAGVDYTKSLEAVAVAEKLSIAGKGDLDSTLTLLVSSLNAYGLSTDEAARFSDALFTTVKLGQTTLPELNESLQAVTGTAATLGVPFEEVLGALAALTATGTPTAQAVTQINAVLSALLKPSAAAATEAERLGLNFSAQAIKAGGLQETLQKVFEATGGNEEIMAKLFPRVEALRAVFPLTGIAADKFAENLLKLNDSAGATQTAYEKLADGLEQTLGRISSSFDVLLVSIGDPLLDDFGGVNEALGAIFSSLGASFSEGELRKITSFIEAEFGRLEEVFQGIATALPAALADADISGFTKGLEAIRDAVSGLFGDLDLTDAEDLARAIEFIANAFNGLSQFSGGIIESFESFAGTLARFAESATEGGDGLRELGKGFGALTQVNIIAGALGGVVDTLGALALVVIGANQGLSLAAGLRGAASALGEVGSKATIVSSALRAIPAVVAISIVFSSDDAFTKFIPGLEGLNERAKEAGRSIQDALAPDFDADAFNSELSQALSGAIPDVPEFGDLFGDTAPLTSKLNDVVRGLTGVGGGVDNYVESLNKAANETASFTDEVDPLGPILLNLDDSFSGPSQAAKDLARAYESGGTLNFISEAAPEAASALKDLSDVSDQLKTELAIAGIESSTQIATSRLEADAEKVSAAFDSIGTTVDASTESISDLSSLLGDDNISKFDKFDIRDQIEEQARIQQDAAKSQKRLIEAQIREANARAKAIRDGGALIKVNGDGLQPHLEAIMFDLFEALQVRVNAEGYEMLLGASS